mgnify:CR=1 FL=1
MILPMIVITVIMMTVMIITTITMRMMMTLLNVNQVNSTHWLGRERWFGETAGGTSSLRCFLLLLFQGFVMAVLAVF